MNIYKILHIFVLCCVINEGLAWFGRSESSSSKKDTSKSSSNGSNKSSSNRRGSGWWGGSRNRPSKPSNPSPKPKPKPKPPAPAPKPKDSGKKGSGWWSGTNRNVPKPKPKPKPEPKKPTETKPKGTNRNVPPKPKGNSNPPPSNKPSPSKPKSKSTGSETQSSTDMKTVIENYEGVRLKAYDAQPNNKKVHDTTIGIGFNLNRPDAEKTFNKVVPRVDFKKVKSGEQTITKDQARALFNHDIDNIYEPRAKAKIGKDVYDKLPSNVKTAVVNAVYRGDLGPKTSQLIKDGKWKEVGKEYLDHKQYKNADKLGIPGVKTRMDWNKEQFDTMIQP